MRHKRTRKQSGIGRGTVTVPLITGSALVSAPSTVGRGVAVQTITAQGFFSITPIPDWLDSFGEVTPQ